MKKPGPWAIGVAIWVLVLAAGGVWASQRGDATARDQLTVAEGRPVVDRAVAAVVATLAPADTIVAVSGFEKVADCDVTPVRPGARYHRVVRVYAKKGTERDVIRRISAALPPEYRARLIGRETLSFNADAGDFVSVAGSAPGPGQIRIAAETGCRPVDDGVDPDSGAPGESPAVLGVLGLRAESTVTHRAGCVETTEVTAGRLGYEQATVEDLITKRGTIVLDELDLIAYREGATDIVLRVDREATYVSATRRCQ